MNIFLADFIYFLIFHFDFLLLIYLNEGNCMNCAGPLKIISKNLLLCFRPTAEELKKHTIFREERQRMVKADFF